MSNENEEITEREVAKIKLECEQGKLASMRDMFYTVFRPAALRTEVQKSVGKVLPAKHPAAGGNGYQEQGKDSELVQDTETETKIETEE